MDVNPYQPPGSTPDDREPSETEFGQLRAVLRSWERLRVFYNVWLAAITLLLGAAAVLNGTSPFELAGLALGGAIVANVCFFAGPLVEAYLLVLGVDFPAIRFLLFLGGTGLATLLALLSIMVIAVEFGPD